MKHFTASPDGVQARWASKLGIVYSSSTIRKLAQIRDDGSIGIIVIINSTGSKLSLSNILRKRNSSIRRFKRSFAICRSQTYQDVENAIENLDEGRPTEVQKSKLNRLFCFK